MAGRPIGEMLSCILGRSPYPILVFRHIRQLGIHVGDNAFSFTIEGRTATLKVVDGKFAEPDMPFWLELDVGILESALRESSSVQPATVQTGRDGLTCDPRIMRLLLRCLEVPPFPLDDREELIYPALFGFAEPQIVWESNESLLRVLRFGESGFVVSSGFTEPWSFEPAEIYKDGCAGAGYELLLKCSNPALIEEFTDWVRYVERTQQHLLPGNWLELEGGVSIPNTDFYGFIVVEASITPSDFIVGDARATLHQLLPVTADQLRAAKAGKVFQVAEELLAELNGRRELTGN